MTHWTELDSRTLLGDHKDHQINDRTDRTADYKDFRRSLPRQYYVADIDHIEYRFVDGQIKLVGILELTRFDYDNIPDPKYFQAILDRYNERDNQGNMARLCASNMGCKAWIVLFRYNLEDFWVFNLTDDRGWWKLDRENYIRWISQL